MLHPFAQGLTHKSIEPWLYNGCCKVNLSGPLGNFLFYVILTISYLWACSIVQLETSSSMILHGSCSSKKLIKIFSGMLTEYFNRKYFPLYTCELLGGFLWIVFLDESLGGGGAGNYWHWGNFKPKTISTQFIKLQKLWSVSLILLSNL